MAEPEFIFDFEQGTPEWFEIRRGIPTASEFQVILTDGKGRETYMRKLAGELLSDQPMETFQNAAMQRGKEMEGEARDRWARSQLTDLRNVGFVRRRLSTGHYVGCSPDSLIEPTTKGLANGILEIKTMRPDLMIAVRENGYDRKVLPEEHRAQCQGCLWVTGYQFVELTTWYRGMPYSNDYAEPRDEKYIAELEREVERFDRELHAMVERHRKIK